MTQASDPLDFTGERFTPECQREIWYEHFHRYALASRWCKDLRILDAASGEGYGSALLAKSAASVEGVDISEQAVKHATQRYKSIANLSFQVADCTALPFADNEFDVITSFETLEHLEAQDQLMSEFRRVLKPGGFLAISSPDKAIYTDQYQTENEFHVKELYRHELESLIGRHFKTHHLLGQKLAFHSAIWSMENTSGVNLSSASDDLPANAAAATTEGYLEKVALDQVNNDEHSSPASINQPAMYFIALCGDAPQDLPPSDGQLWLFDDFEESVYRHYHGEITHNIAAGTVLADLEKQVSDLKQQLLAQQASDQQSKEHPPKDQQPDGFQSEGHQSVGHQADGHQANRQRSDKDQARSWWQRLFSKS